MILITDDEVIQQRKINKDWQASADVTRNVNIASSTPKTILNTSPIDTADQTTANPQKLPKLMDDEETATSSYASNSKAKAKFSCHKWPALWGRLTLS